jgi:hypothetical protein
MPLTQSQMHGLLNAPAKVQIGKAVLRDRHSGELYSGDAKSSQYGSFQGRQGTKRRSRKGSVTTLPNGSRFYAPCWETDVVMYQA